MEEFYNVDEIIEMEHKIHQYCKIYGLNPKDIEYKIDLWDYFLAVAFNNRECAIMNRKNK